MMSRDELVAWLHLVETRGLGRSRLRRLLAAFGSPRDVLGASDANLVEFVGPECAAALRRRDDRRDALPDATWRWLESAPASAPRDIVVLGDQRYPELLLQTADPPLLLYTIGRVELLSAPSVAIVGSRRATPQGLDNAREFARHLSERKLTIVSGLALGIDGAAHEGGLCGPGSTIAFVGTGLDQIYPKRHAALGRRIAEEGLIASEYPLGTDPLPMHFPQRNRLIAGVAMGTLVVEAALQSGSLITANLALEAGREVFAIPGSIHSPQARGCHRLIQQGAKLVETGDDILQELRFAESRPPRAALSSSQPSLFATSPVDPVEPDDPVPGTDAALLHELGHDPVTFDALSARTGLPSDQLAARLLDLELAGVLQRLPGGLLQRRGRAAGAPGIPTRPDALPGIRQACDPRTQNGPNRPISTKNRAPRRRIHKASTADFRPANSHLPHAGAAV
jgi:DNA processing protein